MAHLLYQSNHKALEINYVACTNNQGDANVSQAYTNYFQSDWYNDIVHFQWNFQCPTSMDKSKMGYFKLKVIKYCIIDNYLYWKDPTIILLKCVDENESHMIIIEMHDGACGGHDFWKATKNKTIKARYY